MTEKQSDDVPAFIRRLMPDASERELRDAAAHFAEYMNVVWAIFQRIEREQEGRDSPNSEDRDRVNSAG